MTASLITIPPPAESPAEYLEQWIDTVRLFVEETEREIESRPGPAGPRCACHSMHAGLGCKDCRVKRGRHMLDQHDALLREANEFARDLRQELAS